MIPRQSTLSAAFGVWLSVGCGTSRPPATDGSAGRAGASGGHAAAGNGGAAGAGTFGGGGSGAGSAGESAGFGGAGASTGGGGGGGAGGASGGGPPSEEVTIVNWTKNGLQAVMQDELGNNVDAHDGDLHYFDGVFYLYGTSYDCGWAWNGASTWCGVNVYRSSDLRHWSNGKRAFPLTAIWTTAARCGGPNGCFRPHVVYNPSTRQYVMWLNRDRARVTTRARPTTR